MGHSGYNSDTRAMRSVTLGYAAASHTDAKVFKQNALRKVNEGMDPAQISWREARDGELHPFTVPIVLQLDVTGSMGTIPANLVKGDLPHLMGHLIAGECPDAALLFMAVGDLYSDDAPLQIGQFESGDAELDHWLTTVWLEGNGGGNGGESYSLGWLFAMNLIGTDAWDKRGEKGLFISVGDEPLHHSMPAHYLKQLFGAQYDKVTEGLEFGDSITPGQALEKVRERWNVHHINVGESRSAAHDESWSLLGEGYHEIGRNASVVDVVRKIIKQHMDTCTNCKTPARESAQELVGATAGNSISSEDPQRPQTGAGQSIPEPL